MEISPKKGRKVQKKNKILYLSDMLAKNHTNYNNLNTENK